MAGRRAVALALAGSAGALIVDDPKWKPGTFPLTKDVMLEDTWGYVDSDKYLPLNHKGHEFVNAHCGENADFEDNIPLKDYGRLSTVNWYPDTQRFRDFKGAVRRPFERRGVEIRPKNRHCRHRHGARERGELHPGLEPREEHGFRDEAEDIRRRAHLAA